MGITIAFFADSDFASSLLGTSGKVLIEAVGKGDKSIEDNSTCNLDIILDRDYGVLIPNMPITIYANCKVTKSTTKPLLRAKFQVTVFDIYGNPYEESTENNVSMDIFSDLSNFVLDDSDWYLHTDGFFYYIESLNESNKDNSILQEVDATTGDKVVNFLNGSVIRVPKYLDSSYSGLSIKIKITFQAIQNYIPDSQGIKLPNTITNSLKIFNEFQDNSYESSPISWFDIKTSSDGRVSLSTKAGVKYPENLRLPEKTSDGRTITHLSNNLFKGNNTVRNIYIPSSYESLDISAFRESGLISVDASDSSITEIPATAFYRSNITSIKLPRNLVKIGNSAFQNCPYLNNIEFPKTLVEIGDLVFNTCGSLTNIGELPASLTTLGNRVFTFSKLLRISVNKDNENFYDLDQIALISKSGVLIQYAPTNSATSFVIPDDIVTLGDYAFYGSNYLNTITFGKNLQNVGTSYVIPNRVTNVEVGSNTYFSKVFDSYNNSYLFQNSTKTMIWGVLSNTATAVSYPDEIESIGYDIGQDSSRKGYITKIEIGKNIKSIDVNGLYYFTGNKSFVVNSENTNFKTLTGKELVSYDGKTLYEYASGLTDESYEVPNGIELITRWSFSFSKLKTVIFPDTLTRINYSSFCYMNNLENIIFPEGVYIENNCLKGSRSLKNITIPSATLNSAFLNDCTNLETVTFGTGVTSILLNTLNGCTALKWIEFQRTTPPSFETALIFLNTNDTFVIYVPDDSLDAYKSAHNLTDFADRIKPVSSRI